MASFTPASPTSPDCLFCKIVAGSLPSYKVFENEHALAFLDIFPSAPFHTLVIPKAHYPTVDVMPPAVLGQSMAALPEIARAVKAASGAPGFNVLQNNGSVAMQEIFHAHFHVIPRKEGDGIRWVKSGGRLDDDAAVKQLDKLKKATSLT